MNMVGITSCQLMDTIIQLLLLPILSTHTPGYNHHPTNDFHFILFLTWCSSSSTPLLYIHHLSQHHLYLLLMLQNSSQYLLLSSQCIDSPPTFKIIIYFLYTITRNVLLLIVEVIYDAIFHSTQ